MICFEGNFEGIFFAFVSSFFFVVVVFAMNEKRRTTSCVS